jgi:hypothetical protein
VCGNIHKHVVENVLNKTVMHVRTEQQAHRGTQGDKTREKLQEPFVGERKKGVCEKRWKRKE